MKKVLKNRKGFTLIELLAVIVILAILVMVAIPAVTRYLNYSRQGTFADNAKSAISAVRNDVIMNGYSSDCYYTKDQIDALLERKLTTSPFGQKYSSDSYVLVDVEDLAGTTTYYMCLVDQSDSGDPMHGFGYKDGEGTVEGKGVKEEEIDNEKVVLSGAKACIAPTEPPQCGT